jgi:hypothetical protein
VKEDWLYAFLRSNRATVASDPRSIRVIKLAAISLGAPLATAFQLMNDRQLKTPQSMMHVPRAAHLANLTPLPTRIPHTTDSPPKVAPEINAVAAALGFEAKPVSPQTKRKIPYRISKEE